MSNLKKYIYTIGFFASIFITACSDQDAELTSINYDRLFSPINLGATVSNKVNVKLKWTAVSGADSYIIELYENDSLSFSGNPVETLNDITYDQIPYTISGLESETQYSARVKAVGDSIPESKWSGVYFKTDAEQILSDVVEKDLSATSVTLHWPADQSATEIIVNPGDIHHTVTSDEITNGAATIEGLTPETKYTAKLMKGTKTRGSAEFTTLIDLGGAIAVNPEDDLAQILANAKDGDAFAFYPGTYSIPSAEGGIDKITIAANIEFKAVRPSDRPILNGCILLNAGASLTMKQIIMDGVNTDGSQAIEFKAATTYKGLVMDDCEIRNYVKGLYYVNVAATIDKIAIENCLIHNIECSGGDFMDCRAGAIKEITLSNTTVYKSCAERDMIRYDDKSSNFPDVSPIINVVNNTLVNVSNTTGKRLLYVRFKNNTINFANNLITDTAAEFSNQKNTSAPTFKNNNYFNSPALFTDGSTTSLIFDDSATTFDPGFKDADNGDFTISNEDLITKGIGASRWR